jgi:hypothetical protein
MTTRDPIAALKKAIEEDRPPGKDETSPNGLACRCAVCTQLGDERPVSLPYSVLVALLKRLDGGK